MLGHFLSSWVEPVLSVLLKDTAQCTEYLLTTTKQKIYRGYLLFWGEYKIYFIECGEKNQYFSRVRSMSENADIFTARDEIYLVFAEKK